jgi:peptidoglycan hydrolase CwlO-like protein
MICEKHENLHDDIANMKVTKADKTCLKEYIKRPSPIIIVAICTLVLIPLYTTGIRVWFSSNTASYVYAKAETVNKHTEDIYILKEKVDSMQKGIEEIKTTQKEDRKELKEELGDIKDLLNKLITNPQTTRPISNENQEVR